MDTVCEKEKHNDAVHSVTFCIAWYLRRELQYEVVNLKRVQRIQKMFDKSNADFEDTATWKSCFA